MNDNTIGWADDRTDPEQLPIMIDNAAFAEDCAGLSPGFRSDYCLSYTVTDGSLPAFGPTCVLVTVKTLPSGESVNVLLAVTTPDRKSTRLNSSHLVISYAV